MGIQTFIVWLSIYPFNLQINRMLKLKLILCKSTVTNYGHPYNIIAIVSTTTIYLLRYSTVQKGAMLLCAAIPIWWKVYNMLQLQLFLMMKSI